MLRSIKVSLGLATSAKLRRLEALRREVVSCTQAYINSLWMVAGSLDAKTLGRVPGGSLSYRHRSNCLKVALETISATRKAAKTLGGKAGRPAVRGAMRLSSLVAKIKPGRGSFDYVAKISGLSKGHPVVIPLKSHKRLNHWLGKLGAKIKQGCILGRGWLGIWIEVPVNKEAKVGSSLGMDIGINKLLVGSNGRKYGVEMKSVCARVRRCRPGSKGKRRACAARRDYINREVKKLPWATLSVLGIERLLHLKTGKKKNRSKKFRKAVAPWTYRQVIDRIEQLAQESRVRLVAVDPRNTSRMCPRCGMIATENRKGECFQCVRCHYSADADHVGALNVLAKTFGNSRESMVPAPPGAAAI